MLSYKGDTLGGTHACMAARFNQSGRREEGGRGGSYRLHRQQDEPIASRLDRDCQDPTMASNDGVSN